MKGDLVMWKRSLMSVVFAGVLFGAQSGAAVAMDAFARGADDHLYSLNGDTTGTVSARVDLLSNTFPRAADPIFDDWTLGEIRDGLKEGKSYREILSPSLSEAEVEQYRKRGSPFPRSVD